MTVAARKIGPAEDSALVFAGIEAEVHGYLLRIDLAARRAGLECIELHRIGPPAARFRRAAEAIRWLRGE